MNKKKKEMAEMPSINFKKKDNDYENNVCNGEALNRSRGCACA